VVFTKILIPTDLSEASAHLIAVAGSICNVREILLRHIAHDGGPPAGAPEKQKDRVPGSRISVQCMVRQDTGGDIPAAILKTAETERPSLIVMGARRGILSRSLLGRGATRILTKSRTHVLILRFPAPGIFGPPAPVVTGSTLFARILFPLDFSRPANEALAYLRQIDEAGEVTLLHVIRKIGKREEINYVVREVEKRLADARETIKQVRPDIRVKMMVRFGDPAAQICSVASDEKVSLVMISRYGKMDYLRQVPLGTTSSRVTVQTAIPVLIMYTPIQLTVTVRELATGEFYIAEKIWFDYRQTKSDPAHDRIFAVFVEDTPVSVARCKQHEDGFEVDGIFTWKEFRGNGYARRALGELIRQCGSARLSMYAVQELAGFYASLGFGRVPEKELPRSVRKRYEWAMGDMKGAKVVPMIRPGDGSGGH
jgi:nucleotide-binding universal stress UspA family protein